MYSGVNLDVAERNDFLVAQVALARLRIGDSSSTRAPCAKPLLALGPLSLVLLNHQVDGFLGVVKVELVVFGFLLLLRLLLLVDVVL